MQNSSLSYPNCNYHKRRLLLTYKSQWQAEQRNSRQHLSQYDVNSLSKQDTLVRKKKSENSIETEFDAKYWVCCYTDSQELSNCHGNFYHQEVIGWQSSWFEIILGSQDSISHHESKFHTNDCQICCQLFCQLFFFYILLNMKHL